MTLLSTVVTLDIILLFSRFVCTSCAISLPFNWFTIWILFFLFLSAIILLIYWTISCKMSQLVTHTTTLLTHKRSAKRTSFSCIIASMSDLYILICKLPCLITDIGLSVLRSGSHIFWLSFIKLFKTNSCNHIFYRSTILQPLALKI